MLATAALLGWIITFQLNWRSWGVTGTNMLLFVPQPELDGWGDNAWAQAQRDDPNAVPPGGSSA